MADYSTDVVVVGGTTGGVAAALAVARRGRRCILLADQPMLGGQLTSQAVPPDEHRWIEGLDGFHGATASYVDFRNRIRAHYRAREHLTDEAASDTQFNPGGGWVSRLCYAPAIGHRVLRSMLAPAIERGLITVLSPTTLQDAQISGDRITAVTALADGEQFVVEAEQFLDASDFGDLLPAAGADFRLGSDGDLFGELHATANADRDDLQAMTWCFAMRHEAGENHVGDRPAGFERWATWEPDFDPPWPGKLFSWEIDDADNPRLLMMMPPPAKPTGDEYELWRYRRIVRSAHHTDDRPDVCLWNCVQTDYVSRSPVDDEREAAFEEAKQQAASFFYWMQTEAPRHDGGAGYPGLVLDGPSLGTSDGFAAEPYIREGRRLVGQTTITEQHLGFDQRVRQRQCDTDACPLGTGEPFADSVGVGHYMIDLHPTVSMKNSLYVRATPFRVPLGALVPAAGPSNLLAAGKCLSVSHIANGATRLHPTEWNVGEAAAAAACWAIENDAPAGALLESTPKLRGFQQSLVADGFELAWPWEKGKNL